MINCKICIKNLIYAKHPKVTVFLTILKHGNMTYIYIKSQFFNIKKKIQCNLLREKGEIYRL